MHKHKKIILILLILSVSSCGGTMDSVKRGLTGEKQNNADEFLVKKKDPLVFPPNLDELPTPNEQTVAVQQSTVIEKQSDLLVDESENASSSSIEKSILRKIKTR